jgi:hypothetical protein
MWLVTGRRYGKWQIFSRAYPNYKMLQLASFRLLGYDARIKKFLALRMGPKGPETSVRNYCYTLRNIAEESRSQEGTAAKT